MRVYDVSLFNSDIHNEDTVTLRMLNENRDKVTAWELRDGEWVQIETAPRGKYVILKTTGAKNTICMKPHRNSGKWKRRCGPSVRR